MSEYIVERVYDQTTGLDHFGRREEIVRCRDCKFYLPDMYEHFTCEYLQLWVMPDDFCAWAERKERIES